jgi:ubiquinone biosynthesis protein COQ4
MTVDLQALRERLARGPVKHRAQWRRGLRAMRALLDDPDSTQHAFEVAYALDGDMAGRRFARFLEHPEGRQLYCERPSLTAVLRDREALAALPEASFGREYVAYLERNDFDPVALSQLRKKHDLVRDRDDGGEWFAERADLLHDLWHVLSGYGTDGAGEAALLAFSLGQYGGRSNLLLTFGAGLEVWRHLRGGRWPRYLWRAYQRGRQAAQLDVLRYEELLPLPLAALRAAVGIESPERAHRGGIIEMPSQGPERVRETSTPPS